MGKVHYIVNCYTCQHNGQETCKGCNTLLVGDNEPYENWQLREDLETKDQKIADLEAKLAESEKNHNNSKELWAEQLHSLIEQINISEESVEQLKQQLAEEKNRNKKLNHEAQKYYEDAYCNGLQNQTAIEELKITREKVCKVVWAINNMKYLAMVKEIVDVIDQQISKLKGEK